MAKAEQQLIPLENVSAGDLFAADDDKKLMALAMSITNQAKSMTEGLDINKADDRKEMASVAYKIARSKTTIDDAGKDLVSGLKAKAKVIDERRKHMRDQLDTLKGRIREPLDRWEENEQARIQGHSDAIAAIRSVGNVAVECFLTRSLELLKNDRCQVEAVDPSEYQEFEENCSEARLASLAKVDTAIRKREQHDSEQAELEQLRKEKADREAKEAEEQRQREQEEREAQIAADASRKAELEAEAAKDRERQEKERAEAAEKRAAEAEENAKRELEEEQRREAEAEAEAKRKREANTRHKGKINAAAADDLCQVCGLTPEQARKVVTAIVKGRISFTKIEY